MNHQINQITMVEFKRLLAWIDYKNFHNFESLKKSLEKAYPQLTKHDIEELVEFLEHDLAFYSDAELEDITDEEVDDILHFMNGKLSSPLKQIV